MISSTLVSMPSTLRVLLWAAISLLCICVAASNSQRPERPKVAIIGAGIGGATCAYYIATESRTIGHEYDIHIFEKDDRVGGRIRSFSVEDEVIEDSPTAKRNVRRNGEVIGEATTPNADKKNVRSMKKLWFELGAAVWASPNLFLDNLAQELGIIVEQSDENAGSDDVRVLVYEGGANQRSYELALGDASNLETLSTVAQMEKFKVHLLENYLEFLPRDFGLDREITENKYTAKRPRVASSLTSPWPSIESWSHHGHLDHFTSLSTRDFLQSHGVSSNYTTHHIEPFTRVIYDQGSEANAFAGLVALVSADQTRAASTGLQDMVSTIIKASNATLRLSTPISTLTRTAPGHKYAFELVSFDGKPEYFDIVVLAAPLEFLDIKFTHIPSILKVERREYVGKTSTYVRARSLNTKFFGVPEGTVALLTNEKSDQNGVGFFSIVPHHRFSNGDYFFKVFSIQPMSKIPNSLENWFTNGEILESQEWAYTFPRLNPRVEQTTTTTVATRSPTTTTTITTTTKRAAFQPIVIDPDLYYTSAIDSVAVAMEASTLTSQNIARMIVFGHLHPDVMSATDAAPRHKPVSSPKRGFKQSELLQWLGSYLPPNNFGEIYFASYVGLGIVYTMSDLVWVTPRFNSLFLLALLLIGHTVGYWMEMAVSREALATQDLHAHAILISADVFAGILVALGTWLGDALLPLGMLARAVVYIDAWSGIGAIVGVAIWPLLSDGLISALSLISRFLGGATPSLSILDVASPAAITVSLTLLSAGIGVAFMARSAYKVFIIAPILALSHIGYICSAKLMGSSSLWTRIIPSHVASYLYQDGLAAIVDPLSSTQTLIWGLVPCFLVGAYIGKLLTHLRAASVEALVPPPRFHGLLRFLGGILLVLGMAIHSGSYQFLASYYVSITILGLF
jgi:hypothetical protein